MHTPRTLLLLFVALAAACQGPAPEPVVHERVRPYLQRPGADAAGGNAVVVHLSRSDGRVKEGPGRAAGTPWNSIRLLVSVGTTLPASMLLLPDDRVIDEGDGFELILSRHGTSRPPVLRFEGPCGHRVLAVQSSVDRPDRKTYLAEMQMDGVFLRYLYGAETRADHLRFASWAYRWYAGQECPVPLKAPRDVPVPRSRMAAPPESRP